MTLISDHRAIVAEVMWGFKGQECVKRVTKPLIARLNLRKTNWEKVNAEFVTMDWENIFEACKTVPHMKETLIEIIVKVLKDNGTPEINTHVAKKSIPLKRRRLFRKKGKIEKKLEKAGSEKTKNKVLTSLSKVINDIKKSYEDETELS